MRANSTRRALLGALVGGGVGATALSPAAGLLSSFAPPAGRAWRSTRGERPETVDSPHGEATVTYDDWGVPHVAADTERAAYFAVGYVQAADRFFEMDLVRRRMDGRLAAAVGERALDSDRFHAQMDFRGAAAASEAALAGSRTETLIETYTDGVNTAREACPEPLEFALAEYGAGEWTPLDTLLVGTQIAWGLTGSFEALRHDVLRERLDPADYRRLYGEPFDHGAPIVREATGGDESQESESRGRLRDVDPAFVDALAEHEPSPAWGSNHWAVAGEHTRTGSPMLAYDPHLTLMAPPVWYEQRITVADADVDVRGATLPGIPFVIVGENRHGAWGFTNTGADVVDHYTYETDDEEYRYGDDWLEFETETRTVGVAGGEDREVEVRKTVHGALIDREVDGESRRIGVAWTGMSGTRESAAIYEFSRTRGADDYLEALRKMDVPTQNALYVDDEEVHYEVAGRIPIRRIDGEVVRGDRVFDGSAGEAEWTGFEPFGQSDWSAGGFVSVEETPGISDADYVATANQRPVDDPAFPVGQEYAPGFRGARIYERLDERIENGDAVDREFMVALQNDTVDLRARALVPVILDARDRMDDSLDPYLEELSDWEYRMDRESAAALVFARFYEAFRAATWGDDFERLGLDEGWWPQEWPLVTLPADDPFFDGDRAAVIAGAMAEAVDEIEAEGWESYGDYNRTTIDHPFGGQVPALNYPRYPTDGTDATVFNVHDGAGAGSSWRQVSPIGEESLSVVPGGQSGIYGSDHYADQLRLWADGEHKPMALETPDDGRVIEFREEEE